MAVCGRGVRTAGIEYNINIMKTIFLWSGVGIAIAAGIFFVLSLVSPQQGGESETENLGPDYSRAMPYEGAQHFPEGTILTHQSNPPTSGPHWPDPLRDGIYDKEKPDEAIVHSLEHGRVWISYRPDVNEETIAALKNLAEKQVRVVMTPRAANQNDIALAAWTRLDAFDLAEDGTFDAQRILDFIARYRDKGPEYVPQMTGKKYE